MNLKPLYSLIICGLLILSNQTGVSQELNCQVQINSQQIAMGDNAMFDAMQRSVYEFMNTRRWTNDKYAPTERIECSMVIQIDKQLSTGFYEATFQLSSSRPVYGSTYTSTLFRFQDEQVRFKYMQFDVLDFSDNAYISELTSILGFYAYVILAMDYDSYAELGGQEQWQKAQQLISNAQTSGEKGWQSFSSRNNRYWFVTNYLNARFKPLREANFKYHRQGFDMLSENVQTGRKSVLEAVKLIEKVHQAEPNSFNVRLFFTAKNDEIIKLFSKAEPAEKNEIVSVLDIIDPANSTKYTGIREGTR